MRVLFGGGGTGGHIYPALAVASELGDRLPALDILYVGAEGEIEEAVVPRSGIRLEKIAAGGLHGVGPVRILRNIWQLGRGFFQAWRLVGRYRPQVVFLTGGYASVPVGIASWLRRRPILLYLPDVEPGQAIKLLSRVATRVAINVEASQQYLPANRHNRIIVTGYPLRPEFRGDQAHQRGISRARLGIPHDEKALLVFGGSRGAQSINLAVGDILHLVLEETHVIHISGTLNADECRARRETLSQNERERYHLFDYVHNMAEVLAAADLVVARAGAATLGELPSFGLPSILVPYPFAWRYQKVNADFMVGQGAAIRLNDEDMGLRLWSTIEALLKDDRRLDEMGRNARKMARPNATAHLADLISGMAVGRAVGNVASS